MFVDLVGFRSALGKSLAANAHRFLLFDSVSEDIIKSRLMPDGFSYLVLSDNTRHEIVKVSLDNGAVFLERGQSKTVPISHPCGASVAFEWTVEGLAAQAQQTTADLCADPCADSGMTRVFEFPMCEAGCDDRVEFTTATHKHHLDDNRCLVAEQLPANRVLLDGEYCMGDNSTLTVVDGRITNIQQADCGISQGCSKCGCATTADCDVEGCGDPCTDV
jgi:hypothetical protein